jgi:GR25 family glycosyltransferase involved in LPS biosynthesis
MITDTVIINLKNRLEKRNFALNQAVQYKLPNPRILVASTPLSRRISKKSGCKLSSSEKACCISHVRIWEYFANQSSKDWILVLEDDAFGMVDLETMHQVLKECIQSVPACIDVINIGGRKRSKPKNLLSSGKNFNLYQYDECLYHAYLIRKRACKLWSIIALESSKVVDKVHQVHNLIGRYSVLQYTGFVQPLVSTPSTINVIKIGRGVFSQIRGNDTFQSDLALNRKKII